MACMCGDIMCPSCGPAQGYNPELIKFLEDAYEKHPALQDLDEDMMEVVDSALEWAWNQGFNAAEVYQQMENDNG